MNEWMNESEWKDVRIDEWPWMGGCINYMNESNNEWLSVNEKVSEWVSDGLIKNYFFMGLNLVGTSSPFA